MNGGTLIIFVVLLAALGAADMAIRVSGWKPQTQTSYGADPSPGPTRWH